jgi:hypothetical protein
MHVGFRTRAGTFTLRFSRGGIGLWGPPAPSSHKTAVLEQQAEMWAASLRNDQISYGFVQLVDTTWSLISPRASFEERLAGI